MNKYLIVATDNRSYLDLKNVVLELKTRNLPYFFLYCNSSIRLAPHTNIQNFSYDTNVEFTENTYPSQTLGFHLPFKPTVLLITNENWEPEKTILWEFKQWGCFIGCIENSSWIHNNIKDKLEIASRKSFPTNCIDVFFDHSKWGLETKKKANWWAQKSIIVGNPKHDNFIFPSLSNEKVMIIYGSMEIEHHNKILSIYHKLITQFPEYKIYYKPHPTELKDFSKDFSDINTIRTHDDFLLILNKSQYNIGIFSTVMFHALQLGKTIVILKHQDVGIDEELDIESFNSYKFDFWKKILGFKEFKEFKEFVGDDFILSSKKRNVELENTLSKYLAFYDSNCTFMGQQSDNKKIIKYFDEFNDGKASQRIIDYIENE